MLYEVFNAVGPVASIRVCRDSVSRKSLGYAYGNIFVKNLDKNIDNKALYDTFSLFGNILSCKVAMDPSGNSKGYGFVHYETDDAGKQAIERVNNMQIGEKQVFVGAFSKSTERDNEPKHFTNIYVRNFPADWDEDKVKG